MRKKSYIDKHGYIRGPIEHSDLHHRQIAFKELYVKDRDKYPLPFGEYQIHHKDGNKKNNEVSNLKIVTREEHERIHGIPSAQATRLTDYDLRPDRNGAGGSTWDSGLYDASEPLRPWNNERPPLNKDEFWNRPERLSEPMSAIDSESARTKGRVTHKPVTAKAYVWWLVIGALILLLLLFWHSRTPEFIELRIPKYFDAPTKTLQDGGTCRSLPSTDPIYNECKASCSQKGWTFSRLNCGPALFGSSPTEPSGNNAWSMYYCVCKT